MRIALEELTYHRGVDIFFYGARKGPQLWVPCWIMSALTRLQTGKLQCIFLRQHL